MRRRFLRCTLHFAALWPIAVWAQQTVAIQVDAGQKLAPFKPSWNYFGYDEPNYTYASNGKKLVGELAKLGSEPAQIRAHNILTTGNGVAAFKWGSTNAYTEDASGKPIYDWTLVDRILETYLEAGARPLVELGFMPKALSSHPEPYEPVWKPGDKFDRYYVGWAYPPKDYAKWGELVYQFVKHAAEKYGKAEVETWNWEVWNEPNIGYWHGTPEEYDRLYDFSAAAVKRALPGTHVGGPGSTGPANARAADFLKQFLEHCASGKNSATGETGSPIDFISYHVKGSPEVFEGRVRMGLSKEMQDTASGFAIVKSVPKLANLPIILTEADPEGCAACSAQVYPQNAYRNGTLYPAYTAAALKTMLALEQREGVNLKGILTWAFEFEDQPYFAGFRTLATNGVDKPVLNLFRMAGLMGGNEAAIKSDGALPVDTIVKSGVRERPYVDALATTSERKVSILVWNYQDDDVSGPEAKVQLSVAGLPKEMRRVLMRHYRIDGDHSNAYTLWKSMGSPQNPSPEQHSHLESAGQLQLLNSPCWIDNHSGKAELQFSLPLQGISLVELSW